MRNFIIITLIASSTLIACKNSSKAMSSDRIEPSNSGKNIKQVETQDVTYDMIISFISKGEGVDNKMVEKINAAIATFNKDNNVNLKPEKVGWGREGEVDYNFIAKNLSTGQKKALATKIKETIGSSDMVFVKFNTKSVHKR